MERSILWQRCRRIVLLVLCIVLGMTLFGLLAQNVTPRLYPWYLAVGLVVMVIMSESLHAKKAAEHR